MEHFAVLTSSTGVSTHAVEDVLAWLENRADSIGNPVELSDRATEIAFFGEPPWDDQPRLTDVDLNIVPGENRVKHLLIADMDSTIITVECIDELADFAGKKAEVSDITERAMRGELDFEQALRARVAMLKGVTRQDIETCHAERVHLTAGARELVQTMNADGAVTALVSGGFTVFTDQIVSQIGFLHSKANTLLFDGDTLNGEVGTPICHAGTKLEVLTELLGKNGLDFEHAMAVGDGANDAPMVKAAGLGVAYRAKPALREVADAVLDHSDLTALLALQGISSDAYSR